jgi:hypothetical protein
VFGKTNDRGDIGYGMGHGDYYFAPGEGASCVWVGDESGPSDLVSGLGMLGGTNHRHLDVHYRLVEIDEVPAEKPPETTPEEGPPVTIPEHAPDSTPEDRWPLLLDKLDRIIAMLEERVQ